jgi:hypothetical protein
VQASLVTWDASRPSKQTTCDATGAAALFIASSYRFLPTSLRLPVPSALHRQTLPQHTHRLARSS